MRQIYKREIEYEVSFIKEMLSPRVMIQGILMSIVFWGTVCLIFSI